MTSRWKRLKYGIYYENPDFNDLDQFLAETTSHILIEESAIMYNNAMAEFLYKKVDHVLPPRKSSYY